MMRIRKKPPMSDDLKIFILGAIFEWLLIAILPILFAFYLFGILGRKEQPQYECFANHDNNLATPGIIDLNDDDYYVNVSWRFRFIFWWGFITGSLHFVILQPLKIYFGYQLFRENMDVNFLKFSNSKS